MRGFLEDLKQTISAVFTVAAVIVGGGLFLWVLWISDYQRIFYRLKELLGWLFAVAFLVALLPLPAVAVTAFNCGDEYITFETTGQTARGERRTITVQKRLLLMVVSAGKDGGALDTAVLIGRDGVPGTGANHITPDTYRRLIQCLD